MVKRKLGRFLGLRLNDITFQCKPEDVICTIATIVAMKIVSLQIAPYDKLGFQAEIMKRIADELLKKAYAIDHPCFDSNWTKVRIKEFCQRNDIPLRYVKISNFK